MGSKRRRHDLAVHRGASNAQFYCNEISVDAGTLYTVYSIKGHSTQNNDTHRRIFLEGISIFDATATFVRCTIPALAIQTLSPLSAERHSASVACITRELAV